MWRGRYGSDMTTVPSPADRGHCRYSCPNHTPSLSVTTAVVSVAESLRQVLTGSATSRKPFDGLAGDVTSILTDDAYVQMPGIAPVDILIRPTARRIICDTMIDVAKSFQPDHADDVRVERTVISKSSQVIYLLQ